MATGGRRSLSERMKRSYKKFRKKVRRSLGRARPSDYIDTSNLVEKSNAKLFEGMRLSSEKTKNSELNKEFAGWNDGPSRVKTYKEKEDEKTKRFWNEHLGPSYAPTGSKRRRSKPRRSKAKRSKPRRSKPRRSKPRRTKVSRRRR